MGDGVRLRQLAAQHLPAGWANSTSLRPQDPFDPLQLLGEEGWLCACEMLSALRAIREKLSAFRSVRENEESGQATLSSPVVSSKRWVDLSGNEHMILMAMARKPEELQKVTAWEHEAGLEHSHGRYAVFRRLRNWGFVEKGHRGIASKLCHMTRHLYTRTSVELQATCSFSSVAMRHRQAHVHAKRLRADLTPERFVRRMEQLWGRKPHRSLFYRWTGKAAAALSSVRSRSEALAARLSGTSMTSSAP